MWRAAAFFKLIRYSYGSGCTSYGCQPFDIRKVFAVIWEASRRLANTVVENKDFEALIRQYDRADAFFYCDPPYYMGGGDIKLMAACGLVLGLPKGLLTAMTGLSLLLIYVGIYRIVCRVQRREAKKAFPLAPFLSTGCLLAYFIL